MDLMTWASGNFTTISRRALHQDYAVRGRQRHVGTHDMCSIGNDNLGLQLDLRHALTRRVCAYKPRRGSLGHACVAVSQSHHTAPLRATCFSTPESRMRMFYFTAVVAGVL